MNQAELDKRITEAKARGTRKIKIPGQFESFDIVVENGSTPLDKHPAVARHQLDVTYREDPQGQPSPASPPRVGLPGGTIGDDYTMPGGDGSEPVTIGGVTLRKSALEGYEKAFTRGASVYQVVLEDGTVVNSIHEIVKHVHAAAWRVKSSKAVTK